MALLGWLAFLLGSQAVVLMVMLFWIYLFLPLGNSDHVVISVSIDFSYSQRDAPFHRKAYGYSRADWMTILVPIETVLVII